MYRFGMFDPLEFCLRKPMCTVKRRIGEWNLVGQEAVGA